MPSMLEWAVLGLRVRKDWLLLGQTALGIRLRENLMSKSEGPAPFYYSIE